jgi:HEAT repeat protein
VPIRASSAKQIDALIANLSAENAVARETAIARLTLLGARAAERLIAAAASATPPSARAAAWRALEGIGDARALEPALTALASRDLEPEIGAGAAGVARVHLRGTYGAAALDRLATVLLDRTRHETVRLAALRAVRELEPATIAPILASLANDPNGMIRLEAGLSGSAAPGAVDDPRAVLALAADGNLPDDPAALRHALALAAESCALPLLLKVVERVREREGSEPARAREQWRMARAAAHVALARRGSRLAVYDLRESLETAKGSLPAEFLAAMALVGDATCLEAIAGAYAKSKDGWWRHHLAEAFTAIVKREKLTRRHAVLKRIEKRWPGLLNDMAKG